MLLVLQSSRPVSFNLSLDFKDIKFFLCRGDGPREVDAACGGFGGDGVCVYNGEAEGNGWCGWCSCGASGGVNAVGCCCCSKNDKSMGLFIARS